MDSLDFAALLEAAGREFDARIQRAGFYQHPNGVGDAREDVVREYLQDVLSRRFVVERGKIMDSDGRLSREFDVIISEANDVAPAMMLAGRRIVPIESVYGVIEVKSSLSAEGYDAFVTAVEDLKQMKRRYRRLMPLPSDVAALAPSPFAISEIEINSQDQTAGRIWSGVIAFDAPGGKTLAEYFKALRWLLVHLRAGQRAGNCVDKAARMPRHAIQIEVSATYRLANHEPCDRRRPSAVSIPRLLKV